MVIIIIMYYNNNNAIRLLVRSEYLGYGIERRNRYVHYYSTRPILFKDSARVPKYKDTPDYTRIAKDVYWRVYGRYTVLHNL